MIYLKFSIIFAFLLLKSWTVLPLKVPKTLPYSVKRKAKRKLYSYFKLLKLTFTPMTVPEMVSQTKNVAIRVVTVCVGMFLSLSYFSLIDLCSF